MPETPWREPLRLFRRSFFRLDGGRLSLHHLKVGVLTGRSATSPPLTANLAVTLVIQCQVSEVQPF